MLPLALIIRQDYSAYAPYPLLSPLVRFAGNTYLMVAHTLHEPHTPDNERTVTQQADDLLGMTVSYLSSNNFIVTRTKSIALNKGAAEAPTVGPQGPPTNVVEDTTYLGVIQTADVADTTLSRNCSHTPRGMCHHPQKPSPCHTEA